MAIKIIYTLKVSFKVSSKYFLTFGALGHETNITNSFTLTSMITHSI